MISGSFTGNGNVQQKPQRSSNSIGMIQKPPLQRTLPQHYHRSLSSTKKVENYIDLTLDDSESLHGRLIGSDASASTPSRIGGSRLKLEVPTDSSDITKFSDSPNALVSLSYSQLPPLKLRGRPKLQFQGESQLQGAKDAPPLISSIRGGENVTAQVSLPMPARPGRRSARCSLRERPFQVGAHKKDARPKPYILEVPSTASRYSSNGYTDFFPWTGDHPEDLFTDNVIRQGYFDKIQNAQSEAASAKPCIFSALKHKSGLQTLSSLLTNVLFQRRAHGQIIAAPTFKPPPRVTLTDTKREMWLRDLANPSISLRRLSRTIPHGIRGKVLLEQCLNKNIPTERAVWLAKCVGANEIRAFKRKGVTGTFPMGGEAKWIRDWTAFVEQFVESIVASCGEKDWKSRVLYVDRLGAHLYSELLLDRDHYMDWLLTSLESCSLVKLPIWLLITQVYWKDLLKYRKYGRRLVAALSGHLHAAHENSDRDLLLPLIDLMTFFLDSLMATCLENFISPKMWSIYKGTLRLYLSQTANFNDIDRRNNRISPTGINIDQSPRQGLIKLLDKSLTQPFSNDLFHDCWCLMADRSALIQTVLEWSSSSHRPGLTKIYVASRLLKIGSKSDVDVNDEVHKFIGSRICYSHFCKSSFYHLVSELTRSGHFSISRYLQWLIARGGVREPTDLMEDGPCMTRLLAELPTNDLPESISRLRRTMLNRASFSPSGEVQQLRDHIVIIENCLSDTIACIELGAVIDLPASLSVGNSRQRLSRAIKSEIGLWLRMYVNVHTMGHRVPSIQDWKSDNDDRIKSAITPNEFVLVRRFLEDVQDLSILADVLKVVATSDDIQVLVSTADTLNFHSESFAAIGALNELFDKLLERLSALRESRETDCTPLLASLADLATRLPGSEAVSSQLSQELAQSSRRTAVDVCSPVSDHMAEVLQSSESDFSDEIEKILASGTYMDHSTLERLFEMIILQLEASWSRAYAQQRSCILLLGQLKSFNPKQFDVLMSSWLRKLLHKSTRLTISHVLGPLIALGCLGFKETLTSSLVVLDSSAATNNPFVAPDMAIEILALLIGSSQEPNMLPDDFYRLGIKRLQAQKDFPSESTNILRRAIELGVSSIEEQRGTLAALCNSERMRHFLQLLIMVDLEAVVQGFIMPLAKSPCPEVSKRFSTVVDHLFNHVSDDANDGTLASRIENAFQLADDLTLPFCQLELQYIFAVEATDYPNDEKYGAGCLEAFERAVDSAVVNNNKVWTSIIPRLDIQIARHLCQRAERLFLQLVPSSKLEDHSVLSPTENDVFAKRLLFIVNATRYSIQTNRSLHLASQVVEKVNVLLQIIFPWGESSKSIVMKWLPLVLDFIILHAGMFESTKSGSGFRSRLLLLLSTFLIELRTHSDIGSALIQQIFDVALLLSDDLSEDARAHCVTSLKDKSLDGTVRYVFGFSAQPMDWLQLNQKGKLVAHPLRRWEILSEPTPNVGENDTSLSLTLFKARKL